jgi:outer membrane receptor for ferrienterochelin and colicin
MKASIGGLSAMIVALMSGVTNAAEDFMSFYQEEAKIVSASRIPQTTNQSPATVYVVTQEDIRSIGAKTVWDAIRHVPGVEVIQTDGTQAEVGIRGVNQPLGRRVLVLVDGRSVLAPYFSHVSWEGIPVVMDEIDRIEIVEGPASAVYGGNAISGVINIITKMPEQIQGGKVSYAAGNYDKQTTSFVYGHQFDKSGMRVSGAYDGMNDFDNTSKLVGAARTVNGLWDYKLADQGALTLAGGVNRYDSRVSLNVFGSALERGTNGYLRSELRWGKTSLKSYWNHISQNYLENALTHGDGFNGNVYDTTLEQGFSLPLRNEAVVGGGFRRTDMASAMFAGNDVSQDLWAAFLEDKWQIADQWLLMGSGRFDKHPLTAWHFSPRGSLLYTPVREQVFRVSAGTAFRNPNLVENYYDRTVVVGSVSTFFGPVPVTDRLVGATHLDGERTMSVEVAHEGRFQRFRTTLAGTRTVYYRLIEPSAQQSVSLLPPAFVQNFDNPPDTFSIWTAQGGVEWFAAPWLRLFGSYTYQDIHNSAVTQSENLSNHAHFGLQTQAAGFTNRWTWHWVDGSSWHGAGERQGFENAYWLLDTHLGYAFSNRLKGLEVGFTAFNLLDHPHYEVPVSPTGGTLIRGRYMGEISYQF